MRTAASVLSACLLGSLLSASVAAGDLTVSGRYEHRTDGGSLEMLGGLVCFYPDDESAKRLPRPPKTSSLTWFCFQNSKTAMNQLGIHDRSSGLKRCGSRGRAEVRIDRYSAYLKEGDGFDTARLRAVLRKSPPESIPCA